MIKAGCCAYLLKDTHPAELEKALNEIYTKGHYNGDASNINYRRLLKAQKEEEELKLNDNKKQFLQLACSDLTYKQIAAKMNKSERTIDGYREDLFKKFKVQSRGRSSVGSDKKRFGKTLNIQAQNPSPTLQLYCTASS